MVTRKTRNYKEKKTMTTFGQFILPLTVIMAVALLFFSVKLFFFNSNNIDDIVLNEQVVTKNETVLVASEEKAADEPVPDTSVKKKIDIKPAQPVEVKKEAPKKENITTALPSLKTPVKPSETAKVTVVKVEKPQEASVQKTARWDIQIGAFTSKEYALQLIETEKAKGYSVYLVEGIKDGSPFYKVRVKNPKTGKEAAVALSKKLEDEGQPVFLVEIK